MPKRSRTENRYIANELLDFNVERSENVLNDHNEIKFSPAFRSILEETVLKLQAELNENISKAFSCSDNIYSGTGGIAMLYLFKNKPKTSNLLRFPAVDQARDFILQKAEKPFKIGDRISFLNGNVGILALASVIYSLEGERKKASVCIQKLLQYSELASQPDLSVPDELLYGRSGYLYALLFVRKYMEGDVPVLICKQVVDAIIASGKQLNISSRDKLVKNRRLQFKWHEKEYVGAAHGYCGILHTLLMAYKENLMSEEDLNTYVQPTIDYVLQMQYPSKNIPSSVDSGNYDILVQWCHGAPGAIHLIALAYEIFHDRKYLNAALEFGDVTWNRGLLTKGCNLCHGVAGNAYTFLKLYQLTNDVKHLHRATKFGEWCFDHGTKLLKTADRPFSLFEGIAGIIYFLIDLIDPNDARFPGVELS